MILESLSFRIEYSQLKFECLVNIGAFHFMLIVINRSDAHLSEFWRCVQEWYLDLFGCSKPVVAAINGHAPAGGCAMALMCDYR